MDVSSFTSLWGDCSNVFIRTSQEALGVVDPGENCIGIFVVGFWLLFLIPLTYSVMLVVAQ